MLSKLRTEKVTHKIYVAKNCDFFEAMKVDIDTRKSLVIFPGSRFSDFNRLLDFWLRYSLIVRSEPAINCHYTANEMR